MMMPGENAVALNIIDGLLAFRMIHVVEQIFMLLDNQSLTNAELASVQWSLVIQASQRIYQQKISRITSWFFGSNNTRVKHFVRTANFCYGSTLRSLHNSPSNSLKLFPSEEEKEEKETAIEE